MFYRLRIRIVAIAIAAGMLASWSAFDSSSVRAVDTQSFRIVDDIQVFKLSDGSLISVDYDLSKITIQLGKLGPKIEEKFSEDDFGGLYWDWGQVVPQQDGTWQYEDWYDDDGFKSKAVPVELL